MGTPWWGEVGRSAGTGISAAGSRAGCSVEVEGGGSVEAEGCGSVEAEGGGALRLLTGTFLTLSRSLLSL